MENCPDEWRLNFILLVADTTLKNTNKERLKTMEFLKNILTPELFAQVETAINAHNGNEANKDAQIKLANLAAGEYVGKGKHEQALQALQATLDGVTAERDSANNLIAELKKGAKGNEDLQGKITNYETVVVPQLQEQLKQTKLDAEIKVALLEAKATDIDYLTFKLKEKGEALELGEDGKIKGIDEKIAGLKTQNPNFFETVKGNGKIIEVNDLPKPENKDSLTKAELLKKPYAERMKIMSENPDAYNTAMNANE